MSQIELEGESLQQFKDAQQCIADTLKSLLKAGYPRQLVSAALIDLIRHPEKINEL